MFFQVHFGADYRSGKYGWTLDLDEIKRSIDWQLKALQTDYIDFGFIHCMDEISDLETAIAHGTIAYMEDLKRQGMIRHIGLSSHTPAVVEQVLDMHILDMLMFSINPAYDYRHGEYAIGSGGERAALYRRCEAEGVGISVMKAFSGGQLLDAKTSPFGKALTEYQCMQYALDRPGVLTVLPRREEPGRFETNFRLSHRHRRGKGLFRFGQLYAQGVQRRLRLLQPLSALPGWFGCGAHQQVLRPFHSGR